MTATKTDGTKDYCSGVSNGIASASTSGKLDLGSELT
jgi:hypothetical protein